MSSDKSSIIDKAQKLAAKGQINQAIAEWQRLIAETPNDGNIYNTIGDLHLKANQKNEATTAYLKAADAFKIAGFELKSIAVYKKIIKVDPSQMEVYEKLADVHAERGLTANAVEDYLKVAKHYVKQGDFLSALSVYRKLANLDPQNSSIRLKIAEMCQKQGLEKEAIEEYEKVLGIYDGKGMVSEASALLEQVLKLDPTFKSKKESAFPEPTPVSEPASLEADAVAPELTASVPQVEEPQPLVIEELQPVTNDPQLPSPPSLNERMGQTLAEGNWDEAEKLLEELAEAPLDLFDFLSKWFDRYLESGSFPKAFLILQKALNTAEENSYLTEGRILIERYLQENPHQVSAHQLLAANFEKSDKLEEAVDCHSKVISLLSEQNPEPDARAYYEKIKRYLPALGAVEKWKELFDPKPSGVTPPIENLFENLRNEETSIVDESFEIQIEEEKAGSASVSEAHSEEVDLPDQISEATFKGHLTEAEVYLKYGLYSKAIEQLLLVSELCPLREEPHLQLKEIYLKQGMTEKAIRECWILSRFYETKGPLDKKNGILQELANLDPDGQYKREEVNEGSEKGSDIAPIVPLAEEINVVEEIRESTPDLQDFGDAADSEDIAAGSVEAEIGKGLLEEGGLDELKVEMDQADEFLKEGNRDAAKSLLWKILEKYSNCAEARLKLLNLQESSKTSEPVGITEAAAGVDLFAEGMDETSFEGLSDALERSFSGLMTKEAELSPQNRTQTDDRSLDKSPPNEEYVDLTSIFSEELEEEEDPDSGLTGLEDTVLDDAFKDFQKGIEARVDDQDFETHYNLGIAYKEMGLLPEAIKEFELAFQADLRFQDASMMLAACYRERGMMDTAIEVLTNALSDPRCKKEHVVAIKYELATIYDSEGDTKRARFLYEEVSQLDPAFRDVRNKNATREPESLVKSAPSVNEEREEAAPKRNPGTKKKNKISYL